KGGVAQVETFLHEVAASVGYQRLGKKTRSGVEAELAKLQWKGKVSLVSALLTTRLTLSGRVE
ncbi:MAG: hypothetical protein KUL88_23975, partial [Rhizobium sp.]|nr:hypothetical protein [Rhizobium sp.]